ncbi:MAG: DUF4336 domain-containing protein [Rhodobacteraceae bacterium]|nr:DUF4336 domain-containing protein [Paracoccaceae bacterium]
MTQTTGYEPHFTLKPVAAEIWVVDGPIIRFYGLPFPTRMVVIRLPDGALWLHSPVQPDPGLIRALAILGPVVHLVAPNWIHYAQIPEWQGLYPAARVWAAPGVSERAASRGVALRVDHRLDDSAPADWAGVIDQRIVEGSKLHREAVFLHRSSRTLILTDLIENFESAHLPAWMLPLAWMAGILDPDGKAPVDMRWSFRHGRDRARAAIQGLLAWHPERVILAHGRWYDRDGEAELRRAFRWVLRDGPGDQGAVR